MQLHTMALAEAFADVCFFPAFLHLATSLWFSKLHPQPLPCHLSLVPIFIAAGPPFSQFTGALRNLPTRRDFLLLRS